jgi:hypothetical protein
MNGKEVVTTVFSKALKSPITHNVAMILQKRQSLSNVGPAFLADSLLEVSFTLSVFDVGLVARSVGSVARLSFSSASTPCDVFTNEPWLSGVVAIAIAGEEHAINRKEYQVNL